MIITEVSYLPLYLALLFLSDLQICFYPSQDRENLIEHCYLAPDLGLCSSESDLMLPQNRVLVEPML